MTAVRQYEDILIQVDVQSRVTFNAQLQSPGVVHVRLTRGGDQLAIAFSGDHSEETTGSAIASLLAFVRRTGRADPRRSTGDTLETDDPGFICLWCGTTSTAPLSEHVRACPQRPTGARLDDLVRERLAPPVAVQTPAAAAVGAPELEPAPAPAPPVTHRSSDAAAEGPTTCTGCGLPWPCPTVLP